MEKKTISFYSRLVEYLGRVLGPSYEVILHDVDQKCVVAIANGQVSGRSVGAPLTDWALEMIAGRAYEHRDYVCNYSGRSKEGKLLRSSTFFIKGEDGTLEGMLCVNLDVSRYEELSRGLLELAGLDTFLPLVSPSDLNAAGHVETFSESVADVTATVLSGLFGGGEGATERLTQEDKMNAVRVLNQKGIFFLKGAVSEVASQLQCSEASIYRYLSKINKAREKASGAPGF